MTNFIFQHDQSLAYIQNDSYKVEVDNEVSFEIIAREFEGYWRHTIAKELMAHLLIIDNGRGVISTALREQIVGSIWKVK